MTDILPKTFDPSEIEPRLYAHWEATNAFRPARPDAQPFTIVIPPPNVTGSLHIGHALDNTLQDVLIRYHRLKGRDALWVVGTDHAGIATQMVVERTIAAQGLKRSDMSREAFLAHVWEWKAQSGGTITRQLRRLGASCDWAHERFTMDEGFSARGDQGVRDAVRAGPALPRQAAGQLGPQARHGDQRPRGRVSRDRRVDVALPLPAGRWLAVT